MTNNWDKVKRPIPIPNDLTRPYWEAAKQGVLALQHCRSCGSHNYPPYPVCMNCMSTELKFEPVRGKGTIYTYTIMYHTGDKRFSPAVPYACIVVEMDEAKGCLLAGNLLDSPYTEARVGRRVEVIFEKLNEEISLPQFRLAEE